MPLRIEYYAMKAQASVTTESDDQEGFAKAIQGFVLGVPA
jgi:hypothetical protein